MTTLLAVQLQKVKLAGSGCTSSATSIILQSLKYLDGTDVVTADFGDKGFATIEPGTSKEEQISFTSVTQNADETATLTGVTRGLAFNSPYAETAGLKQSHAGGSILVISNTAGFYGNIKDYADAIAAAGAADSSDTTKGITKLSTTPASASNPIAVGDNDPRVPTQDQNDALDGNEGTPSSTNKYVTETGLTAGLGTVAFPTGILSPYLGRTAPTGWLLCNGAAVPRATYAALKAVIAPEITFTVTMATPAVFTSNGHGLVEGDKVSLTTTGGLYSGLSANTDYYVIATGLTTDAFQLSAARGSTAVNTSGSQSGVHTLHKTAYGKGDGATTFALPDMRGMTAYGYNSANDKFDALNVPNTYAGEETHVLLEAELAAHTHTTTVLPNTGASITVEFGYRSGSGTPLTLPATNSAGSNTAHNNLPPYVVTNWIIKT